MSIQKGDKVVVEERGVEDPQVMEVESIWRGKDVWCTWREEGETSDFGNWFSLTDLKKVQ